MTQDLSIGARATQFCDLVGNCVVTASNGDVLTLEDGISALKQTLAELRGANGRLYIIGNGGSAAVASHAVVDFLNVGKLKVSTLHEASSLTCMSNDYGYENAYARMIERMAVPGDVVIAISSSGNSMNIRNAAQQASQNGGQVVTFSGFSPDNPLREMGSVNFWIDSDDYGFVEIAHQFLLHNISDRLGAS